MSKAKKVTDAENKTKENHAKIINEECHKKLLIVKKCETRINNMQENMGIKYVECSSIGQKY